MSRAFDTSCCYLCLCNLYCIVSSDLSVLVKSLKKIRVDINCRIISWDQCTGFTKLFLWSHTFTGICCNRELLHTWTIKCHLSPWFFVSISRIWSLHFQLFVKCLLRMILIYVLLPCFYLQCRSELTSILFWDKHLTIPGMTTLTSNTCRAVGRYNKCTSTS